MKKFYIRLMLWFRSLLQKEKQSIKRESFGMILEIKRVLTDNEGTSGVIYTEGFCCYSLELPWRENIPYLSSIPSGIYAAKIDDSVKVGGLSVIRLDEVVGRSGILIHVGNWAGDKKLEYKSDVYGCIIPGYGFNYDDMVAQRMVTDSKDAMAELLAIARKADTIGIAIENIYKEV